MTLGQWLLGIKEKIEEIGIGVPSGGTAGQVLAKNTGDDFDIGWVDQSGVDPTLDWDEVQTPIPENPLIVPISSGGTGASTIVGALTNLGIADYITERGTNGDWYYEKWNSGIAKCWANIYVGNMTYPTGYGYDYKSDAKNFNYPITFTEAPIVIPIVSDDGDGVRFGLRTNSTTYFGGHFYCPRSMTTPYIHVYVEAVGMWK